MADWTSLAGALNAGVLSAFGREVVYSPQTGQQATVKAIFEETREAEENAPGVYAAGDVSVHAEQVTRAMGEGSLAAIWIHKALIGAS